MGNVSPQDVKKLRDITGVGMNKCKEALEQAQGNIEKAIEVLRKAGMSAAIKKEGREAKEGSIFFHDTANAISLIEMNCETDFVAKNERFVKFSSDIAKQAAMSMIKDLKSFLGEKHISDNTVSIEESRNILVQSLGENIQIRRLALISKNKNSSYGIYSHMGGKIVCLVEIEGAVSEGAMAKDIAMHIAAESPEYLSSDNVPEEVKAKEKEIARSQIKGKPENIVEKIVEGKLKAYFDQFCLLNQKFVKNNTLSIQQLVEARAKEIGKPLKITNFWRWRVGQSNV